MRGKNEGRRRRRRKVGLFLFQKRARPDAGVPRETNVKMFENGEKGRKRRERKKERKKGAAVYLSTRVKRVQPPHTERREREPFLGPAPNDPASRRRRSSNGRLVFAEYQNSWICPTWLRCFYSLRTHKHARAERRAYSKRLLSIKRSALVFSLTSPASPTAAAVVALSRRKSELEILSKPVPH